MIGYVLVGSNNISAAKQFYDSLFPVLNVVPVMEHPSGGRIYGVGPNAPTFGVVPPHNGESATAGNGTMVGLAAASRAQVDAVHAKALELGAKDEGAPGVRGGDPNGFYGAYFRDLDGNKICAFRFGPAD